MNRVLGVQTAAKVDRTRTECLHESNRQVVGLDGCRKIVPGCHQERKPNSGMPVNVYSTANVLFVKKNLSYNYGNCLSAI